MAEAREALLEAITEHDANTRSLFLRLAAPLAFRPGQFISCLLPIGGETLIRPYSIASRPEESSRLELLFNRVPGGRGSRYLFGLRPGDPIHFTGPWGVFTLDRAPDGEAVFIAEDTAIAPVRPMLHRAAATARHPLTLLHATDQPLYHAELAALRGVTVAVVPRAALLAEVERRWVRADSDRRRHFYLCGIGAVVLALRDCLRGAGYARRAVQYEKW